MRLSTSSLRPLGAGLLLTAASILIAGPGAQVWQNAKPISTFTAAQAVGAADVVILQCRGCKTVMIRHARHAGPAGKRSSEWYMVGAKHTCDECQGEISVVRGRTEDAMQHDCSTCGEATVTCCVAPVDPTKP